MPRPRPWPPLLAAAALSGCFATQRDILDLSQQNDTISLQVQSLKKVMTQLQANQADLNARLEDLHKDMSVLNETLKDNRESTARLSSKMDDLGAAIGGKVSSLQRGIEATQETLKRDEERRRVEAAENARRAADEEARRKAEAEADARAREAAAAAEASAAAAQKPSEIFLAAREQLDKKQYDLAAKGFELYLEKFPKGEAADLAAYQLGQTRFAQERWEDAARSYAVVLDQFPKSDVTPACRLRYAQSLVKMKTHLDEARRYLESIPHDFPKSPEAVKAKELLKTLNGKK